MTCPSNESIDEFVEGTLAGDALSSFEEHMDACTSCREVVSALVRLREETPAKVPSEPEVVQGVVEQTAWSLPDRYQLISLLGRGAMGAVFLAEDRTLRRKVALKMMRPQRYGEALAEGSQERFMREARNMAQVSHRNVVAVHDYGYHEGHAFIAMEYIEGQSLREWLASATRTVAEIVAILREAGEGLVAAHAAGLIHRDFKADNVLVGSDGRVLISDFGLSRDDEGSEAGRDPTVKLTKTGVLIGTPRYMAPEQHVGGVADEASDQYAYAATFYEALAGRAPFAANSHRSLVADKLANRLAPLPMTIPRTVRAAISQGLQADAALRFSSVSEFLIRSELPRRWLPGRASAAALVLVSSAVFGVLVWSQFANNHRTVQAPTKAPPALIRTVALDAGGLLEHSQAQHEVAALVEAPQEGAALPRPIRHRRGGALRVDGGGPSVAGGGPSVAGGGRGVDGGGPSVAGGGPSVAGGGSGVDAGGVPPVALSDDAGVSIHSRVDAGRPSMVAPAVGAHGISAQGRLTMVASGVTRKRTLKACRFCDVADAGPYYILRFQQLGGHATWLLHVAKNSVTGPQVLQPLGTSRGARLAVSLTDPKLSMAFRGLYTIDEARKSTISLDLANARAGGRLRGRVNASLVHPTSGATLHFESNFDAPIPR